MADPMRVIIADDNYLVREGTRRLLEDSGQVKVQAAVGSAPELLDAVQRARPEAVLTDIRMPLAGSAAERGDARAMEGIDAAHAIKASDPQVGVVVLSQYADESYAFELFKTAQRDSPTCSKTASATCISCCPPFAMSPPGVR